MNTGITLDFNSLVETKNEEIRHLFVHKILVSGIVLN